MKLYLPRESMLKHCSHLHLRTSQAAGCQCSVNIFQSKLILHIRLSVRLSSHTSISCLISCNVGGLSGKSRKLVFPLRGTVYDFCQSEAVTRPAAIVLLHRPVQMYEPVLRSRGKFKSLISHSFKLSFISEFIHFRWPEMHLEGPFMLQHSQNKLLDFKPANFAGLL